MVQNKNNNQPPRQRKKKQSQPQSQQSQPVDTDKNKNSTRNYISSVLFLALANFFFWYFALTSFAALSNYNQYVNWMAILIGLWLARLSFNQLKAIKNGTASPVPPTQASFFIWLLMGINTVVVMNELRYPGTRQIKIDNLNSNIASLTAF